MKAITVHVSEPIYREFQDFAKRTDRKTAELIREAMELYRTQCIRQRESHSLLDHEPVDMGKPLKPSRSRADLLEDFLDDRI
jgi:hypothetical protein